VIPELVGSIKFQWEYFNGSMTRSVRVKTLSKR